KKWQFVLLAAGRPAPGFRDSGPTAAWGLVSNLRQRMLNPTKVDERHSYTLLHYPTLLQLDTRLASVSGAAVLNLDGELVGLTTARAAVEGGESPGAFAQPLDAGLQRAIAVLRRGEEVEYGFLGIAMQDRQGGDGVVISSVETGSPAERGGVRMGDVLLSV